MAADILQLVASVLARAESDRKRPPMVIERYAESRYFPKWAEEDEEMPSEEEESQIGDEYREIFEGAVDAVAAAWGEPDFFGSWYECRDPWGTHPWGPLGEEVASWPRDKFVVCVYFGKEDQELPFAVDVAVIRRDADWSGGRPLDAQP